MNQTKRLTKEEQGRFLSYVDLEWNEFKRQCNLGIIDLMLYSGLQVHEVSSYEDIRGDIQVVVREDKEN